MNHRVNTYQQLWQKRTIAIIMAVCNRFVSVNDMLNIAKIVCKMHFQIAQFRRRN